MTAWRSTSAFSASLRRGALLPLIAAALLAASACGQALACTLWSATGISAGGGTLLAKNRDYSPDSFGRLILVRPANGLAYVGLFARVKNHEALVAGVNEAGVAMVSATASSVPREARKPQPGSVSPIRKAMTGAHSVDEVLANAGWFSAHNPVFYMLSDARRSAWVEVGPGGVTAVRKTGEGVLTHTNHYLSDTLAWANAIPGSSSLARQERVTRLLARASTFSLEDFQAISRDKSGGPDNAIFRAGSSPASTRTMATFLVRNVPDQPPTLLVSGFGDPSHPWNVRLVLDQAFWARAAAGTQEVLAQDAVTQ